MRVPSPTRNPTQNPEHQAYISASPPSALKEVPGASAQNLGFSEDCKEGVRAHRLGFKGFLPHSLYECGVEMTPLYTPGYGGRGALWGCTLAKAHAIVELQQPSSLLVDSSHPLAYAGFHPLLGFFGFRAGALNSYFPQTLWFSERDRLSAAKVLATCSPQHQPRRAHKQRRKLGHPFIVLTPKRGGTGQSPTIRP